MTEPMLASAPAAPNAAGNQPAPGAAAVAAVPVQTGKGEASPANPPEQSTQPQPKGEAEKPAEKQGKEETKAPKGEKDSKVPEKYEFTTPKGLPDKHTLDPEVVADFSAVAKELGLPQDSAQKLLDKVMPTIYRRGLEATREMHAEWVQDIRGHKTLGGEKLLESKKVAQGAIDHFDPEGKLGALLTGPLRLGDNPAFFEFVHAVGAAMKNDAFVGSNRAPVSGASDDAALAQRLYKTT